jgi:hypothetical protein
LEILTPDDGVQTGGPMQQVFLTIPYRYHGPPNSGNGGYTSGRLAAFVDGTAQVTLRKPPPLDTPMQVVEEGGAFKLMDGDELVAEAQAAALELDVPAPPSLAEAEAASKQYAGFSYHEFPTCFVCGHERPEGEGLHIFAGAVAGRNLVASPWTPGADLADENGLVRPEFLWAALDCPGAFAIDSRRKILVLGRLTAEIHPTLKPGQACVVTGWEVARDGRKHTSGTAIHTAEGELIGKGKSIWIEVEKF